MEHKLEYRIETVPKRIFQGIKMRMSLSKNMTAELWRSFMPRRNEIPSIKPTELVSLNAYPKNYFEEFIPQIEFDKWALSEINEPIIPIDGMEIFTLEAGIYAVFQYKGLSTDPQIYKHIYFNWLPNSGFELEERPHFEVLGEKYKNNDPDSEEEIWIPVNRRPLLNREYLN